MFLTWCSGGILMVERGVKHLLVQTRGMSRPSSKRDVVNTTRRGRNANEVTDRLKIVANRQSSQKVGKTGLLFIIYIFAGNVIFLWRNPIDAVLGDVLKTRP